MSANSEEASNIKTTASGLSFALGAIFSFAFLAFNDPDRVKLSVAIIWFLIYLIPAPLFISIKYRETSFLKSFLNAIAILAGIFVGTCVAMIVFYMNRAGLFPIVAAIWTIVAVIPVAFGSLIGFLLAYKLYK
ncbi:MAG: hypothetical protein P8Z37_14320 [Acidobacteriota bacterium]